MKIEVTRLSSAHQDETVVVLCESFYDYPVMRFVLADAGRRYDQHLSALVAYLCSRRLVGDGWVLGAMADGNLAGVSIFDEPGGDMVETEEMHQHWLCALVRNIGESAVARLSEYDKVGESLMPQGDYHYLGMLGVLSRYQGLGLGKQLVEATQALAAGSPASSGVCLSTETPGNVPFYQHLGFEIVGEAEVGDVHTWCMFSPH
jgi:GNAT superfamily N-acetyltransferase